MNLYDTLPDAAATVFGAEATGSSAYDVLTVDVPVGSWIPSSKSPATSWAAPTSTG
ncbi:hypothetical protein GCM10020254_37620 [Streptomyces goshikiensis]